jgi:uncharacterized protein YcgL (UPF0745 family)
VSEVANNSEGSIDCWVYRSGKTDELYIYLAKADDFESIPEPVRKKAGELTEVMQVELSASRKLARVDVNEVMRGLREQGFFLQLPPNLRPDLYFGD